MKKWFVIVLILLLISVGAVYIFYPSVNRIHQSASFPTNREGLYRNVFEKTDWNKWWPGTYDSNKKTYQYNGYDFRFTDKQLSSLQMTIVQNEINIPASLTIVAPGPDSVTLNWVGSQKNSTNPFSRIKNYYAAKQLERDLKIVMDTMGSFFSDVKNIYGYDIQKASVVDSNLVFTSGTSKGYPSTSFIYKMVDELRSFIKSGSAKETGHPMLNIFPKDSVDFLVRVAIPVDRRMESTGSISYKWMLGGGNILITEVKGGPYEMSRAFKEVEHYVRDHQRIAPAIPFYSLVTDRRTEPDSAKWVTRIYYPVM